MNKLVITRWNGRILTAQFADRDAVELGLEEETSILGNIYIGKVKTIVKNLNSAFVEFGDGMTGYYSMTDNPSPLFADGVSRTMRQGDDIIVQVAKDAIKSKDPVLTSNLNFTGKYAVVTACKTVIGFSGKIADREWKENLRPVLEEMTGGMAGVIVRTNAYGRQDALLSEVTALMEQCRQVIASAAYRVSKSLLYEAEPEYLKSFRSCPAGILAEIVTDQPDVYQTFASYFARYEPQTACALRLYEDSMLSLGKLYSLETIMEHACQKRVWLKSGGYLVIEYTEAMVVIDVNTGKYSGKKNLTDTIRMINLEAAEEISRQLRLRNLSGIILVDFIDMKDDADKELLMETLRSCVKRDPVKTTVVDMTQLNLVELTRKKEKKPLWEQLASVSGGGSRGR